MSAGSYFQAQSFKNLGDIREDCAWKEEPAGIGILKIGQWVAKLWEF